MREKPNVDILERAVQDLISLHTTSDLMWQIPSDEFQHFARADPPAPFPPL